MSFLDTIKSLAPTVASALLGPMGGVAVAAIGSILGMSEPTQDKIAKVFADGQIKPEDMAKIRQLEIEFKTHESEMGYKYRELEFKDTDSARQMQIAVKSNVPPMLAGIVTLGFFGILGLMIFDKAMSPTEPLLVMLGSLGTAWTMIIGFYFGSSHGSQNKDALLAASPSSKS